MDTRTELAIPEPGKPEIKSDSFRNNLNLAVNTVGDKGVREFTSELFYAGGFLFEKHDFATQSEIEGLVVASGKNHVYLVRLLGKEDPMLTITVNDLQNKEIAHLTLTQVPNFRPELWNHWQDPKRTMTEKDRQELLEDFTEAKLDRKQTRERAVTVMWETLRGKSIHDLPGTLGDIMTMGKGWGDFMDAKHGVLHTLPPPKDVVYDYDLSDEPTNLLDEPGGGNWKTQVQKSFFKQRGELLHITTLLEGTTGHRVVSFKYLDFEMLPTKRGLDVFNKLEKTIPIMLSSLTEEESITIFEGIGDELPTWDFVMPHLREGVEDGFFKDIGYVVEEERTESKDEIDQEFTQRANKARGFRFLAQASAQKVKTGIGWRFMKEKSEALQELAKIEKTSIGTIAKKYSL